MRLKLQEKIGYTLLYLGIRKLLRFVLLNPDCVNINVTENCNSRCITCHAWKNDSKNELTTRELKSAFHQLRGIGIKTLIFVGGEPLLRSDIGELIKEASLAGFENIIVVTNGLLLERKAEELVNSGVTHVTVSIDGFESTNDIIRGIPGSYYKAIKGIKALQRIKEEENRDVTVTILSTILLEKNVEDIPKLIEVAQDLGVYWFFNLLDPNLKIFKGIPFSELLVKDEKKIDETIDYIKKVHRNCPQLIYTCDYMLEYARNYLKGKNRYDFHCVHGYKMLYLGAHGEIHPGCWVMEPIGNIRKNRLTEVVGSRRHREIAEKMYMMNCPGCTNMYEVNLEVKHLIPHKLRCRRNYG